MSETWVCEVGHQWKHTVRSDIPRPLFCPHCGNSAVNPLSNHSSIPADNDMTESPDGRQTNATFPLDDSDGVEATLDGQSTNRPFGLSKNDDADSLPCFPQTQRHLLSSANEESEVDSECEGDSFWTPSPSSFSDSPSEDFPNESPDSLDETLAKTDRRTAPETGGPGQHGAFDEDSSRATDSPDVSQTLPGRSGSQNDPTDTPSQQLLDDQTENVSGLEPLSGFNVLDPTQANSASPMDDLGRTDKRARGVPTGMIPPGELQEDGIPGTLEKPAEHERPTDKLPPGRFGKESYPHIPGYEILDTLGRGGMGVVYKARHISLNRECAVKMVLGGISASQSSILRFKLEAEAVAQLQHPNIVQVYDTGEHNGQPFFSLEYVQGGTLQQQLKEGSLPPREAAQLLAKLARGVFHAHQHGIIHRDLKPANILMDVSEGKAPGEPKITDFGLAKRLNEDDGYTGDGDILGTPTYMAPEQAQGRTREIGTATDVYALGAILYDLLTGRPPFKGETVMDTLQQVVHAEPIPPSRRVPNVPRDLETICLRCLQKRPHDRYSTAEALADDLDRFLTHRPIQARRVGALERMWKWSRRNPAAAALVLFCVVGVIVLAVGGYVIAQREANLRGIAEQERKVAMDQKAEAERQRVLADKHFEQAKSAVEEMLTRVGQQQLAYTPAMTKVRRDLLQRALHFYQQFLQDRGDSATLRQETARAFQRVGDIQSLLGDVDAARSAYSSAIEILSELAQDSKNTTARLWLGEVHAGIGVIEQRLNRMAKARKSFETAARIFLELHRESPNNEKFQFELARVQNSLGNLLQAQREKQLAIRDPYSKSIRFLEELVVRNPEPRYAEELARVRVNLATLLAPKEPNEAEKLYTQARQTLLKLALSQRDVPRYRMELGRTALNLGSLRFGSLDAQTALGSLREASRYLVPLVTTYPYVEDYRFLLALTYSNLTLVHEDRRDIDEAKKAVKKAIEHWEWLHKEQPKSSVFQHELAKAYHQQGTLAASEKDFEKGRTLLGKAIRLEKELVDKDRKDPRFGIELAKAQLDLGILEAKDAKADPAETQYKAALASLEALPKTASSEASRVKLICHLNLALLYLSTNRDGLAKPHEQELVKLRNAIQNGNGHRAELEDLSRNWATLGLQRRARRDFTGAIDALQQSLAIQKAALERQPKESRLQKAYAQVALELVKTYVAKGDHATAIKIVKSTLKRFPKSGGLKEKVAAEIARCVKKMQEDGSLTKAEKQKRKEVYGALAVDVLREAVKDGYRDDIHLETARVYEVLQERKDFQELLEKLITGKSGGAKTPEER